MTGNWLSKALTSQLVTASPPRRTRKVESNVRKRRCTFPKWLLPIRKVAHRRASVLRKKVARRSARPCSQGRRSMADEYASRLKAVYDETIAKAMVAKFGYQDDMQVHRSGKVHLKRDRHCTRRNHTQY